MENNYINFLKGDKVKVIGECQSFGMTGTVVYNCCNNELYITVDLDEGSRKIYNRNLLKKIKENAESFEEIYKISIENLKKKMTYL